MKNKYKICVYAISKNEEKFVKRWYESMKEADEIYVLDTGSTDNTVNILKSLNVKVIEKEIKPWRFDVARNESLNLLPKDTDICICTDLDEVFNPGWRNELESAWKPNTTRIRYNYNWHINELGIPDVSFYLDKIHKRTGYSWYHPVHEVLTTNEEEVFINVDKITLNHYPDKEKSRSSYLPLLELSVKEDPTDDRNMHYLGREYMYYKRYNEAIDTLIKHLNLKKATWHDERAASMRYIARCYTEMNRFEEAKMWLKKAITEAPYLRDAYIELSLLLLKLNEYNNVIKYTKKALSIKKHEKTYINEIFSWNYTPYDLISVSYFYLHEYDKSYMYSQMALFLEPNNERLIKNNELIKKYLTMVK